MISDGIPFLRQSPYMVFFPGMAIMITVLGFNLLGDGLRDAWTRSCVIKLKTIQITSGEHAHVPV